MTKRHTLDGLMAAVSKGVKLADSRPLPAMGAGLARAKAKRAPKLDRYAVFPIHCEMNGLPIPTPEFRFHPSRKWRFDFAFIDQKLAIEIEGALWTNGGHSRGSGRVKDHEKFAEAAAHGWRIIPRQPSNIYSLETIDLIRRALAWHEIL